MFYSENLPSKAARPALKERRVKITVDQDEDLSDFEKRLNIPASALVRMALDSFLPKIANSGFTEKGIRAGYLNKGY